MFALPPSVSGHLVQIQLDRDQLLESTQQLQAQLQSMREAATDAGHEATNWKSNLELTQVCLGSETMQPCSLLPLVLTTLPCDEIAPAPDSLWTPS